MSTAAVVIAMCAVLASTSSAQTALSDVEALGDGTGGLTGVPKIGVNGLRVIGESPLPVVLSLGAVLFNRIFERSVTSSASSKSP